MRARKNSKNRLGAEVSWHGVAPLQRRSNRKRSGIGAKANANYAWAECYGEVEKVTGSRQEDHIDRRALACPYGCRRCPPGRKSR